MGETPRQEDAMSTWTDELNAALAPLNILLAGVDAASLLPDRFVKSPREAFEEVTDDDLAAIAQAANEYCETDQIHIEQIRSAVRKTLWHWSSQ